MPVSARNRIQQDCPRVIGVELAKMIVDEWLEAEYEGGRHSIRVGEIMEIEETQHLKEAEQ